MALEQGREVFAVPGSPLDPRAEGTNGLLKQGAALVTEAADVIRCCNQSLAARSTCRQRSRIMTDRSRAASPRPTSGGASRRFLAPSVEMTTSCGSAQMAVVRPPDGMDIAGRLEPRVGRVRY